MHELMMHNHKNVPYDETLFDQISSLNNELMNMHRQVERQKAELTKLNELKNQFLGMAAHDLHNPLSTIISYSEFLEQEISGTLDKEQVRLLSRIIAKANFMAGVIEDFLDVSMIESGKIKIGVKARECC